MKKSLNKNTKAVKNKALFLMELREALQEAKLAKQGKIKLKSSEQLLNEL
jgi:hypothetical protein